MMVKTKQPLFRYVIINYFFMKIEQIIRRGKPLFIKKVRVGDLDKNKMSNKFLSHNFKDDEVVNVKCYQDGTLDLRGKKEEYRIIVEDGAHESREKY